MRERDHGRCAGCGQTSKDWDVDHIIPLWMVDREDDDAVFFYMLPNLQTLCERCHKEKSRRESTARAKANRIRAQGGLLVKKRTKREKSIAAMERKKLHKRSRT